MKGHNVKTTTQKSLLFFSVTRNLLPVMYATKERGKIEVKGKGEMTTYWLENKTNRNPPHQSEVCTYQAV